MTKAKVTSSPCLAATPCFLLRIDKKKNCSEANQCFMCLHTRYCCYTLSCSAQKEVNRTSKQSKETAIDDINDKAIDNTKEANTRGLQKLVCCSCGRTKDRYDHRCPVHSSTFIFRAAPTGQRTHASFSQDVCHSLQRLYLSI